MSDFTGEADIVSDGTSADVSASASSSTDDTAVTADTTALENELEKAVIILQNFSQNFPRRKRLQKQIRVL